MVVIGKETLSFHLDNLAHIEDVNAEEDANERHDDIMAIDHGSCPSKLELEPNEAYVTFDMDNR